MRTFVLFLAVALIASQATVCFSDDATRESTDGKKEGPKGSTFVVMLGTGTPTPDPNRSGPAVAIVVHNVPYLVDIGAGVVRRAVQAYQKGVYALHPTNINVAFITHLHSDHTVGLADLIFTPWVVGRSKPLNLYGPPGVKSMADHILKAYEQDIDIRVNGLEMAGRRGIAVNAHDVEPGLIYTDKRVKVTAIKVNHGSWKRSYGYRFDTPDRTVVISGDTAPSENLIEQSRGCDVLVHEVYCAKDFANLARDPHKYHSTFHTSAIELGRIAAEIKPKLLVLYHQLGWSPPSQFIKEVKEHFEGKVVYGNDLDVF